MHHFLCVLLLRHACLNAWLPPYPLPPTKQAICQLLLEVREYFEAAVAALEGAEPPAGAAPALRAAPELERFLNAQLAGAGARAGRAPQAQLEEPLAELEAAVPGLAKTHLARHLV